MVTKEDLLAFLRHARIFNNCVFYAEYEWDGPDQISERKESEIIDDYLSYLAMKTPQNKPEAL